MLRRTSSSGFFQCVCCWQRRRLTTILLLLMTCFGVVSLAAAFGFVTTTRRIGSNNPLLQKKHQPSSSGFRFSVKPDDDDDEMAAGTGMAEAFRELEALESLGGGGGRDKSNKPKKKESTVDPAAAETAKKAAASAPPVAPEAEVQVYKALIEDLQTQNEDDLYQTVLNDMGGSSSGKAAAASTPQVTLDGKSTDTQAFLDQALQQAMQEAKEQNPNVGNNNKKDSSIILDDAELMKEIEAIFERGNDQLLQSLDEIRSEQKQLAREQADASATSRVKALNAEKAQRLEAAEASMQALLHKVNQETQQVEQAVRDLKRAQEQLLNDNNPAADAPNFLVGLKQGGIPKQAAFVGAALFSVRGLVDTLTGHGSMGTVEGAIALACLALLVVVL